MSSYSASAATRRGSFVPPLVGIDDNLAQSLAPLAVGSGSTANHNMNHTFNFNPQYSVKPSKGDTNKSSSGDPLDPQVASVSVPSTTTTTTASTATTTETYDVMICGTGLPESILAAALAWQGSTVLHIDNNPYYGDYNAILNTDSIQTWVNQVNSGSSSTTPANSLGPHQTFRDAQLYIPRPLVSRHYLIDLTPKIIFAKSDLLALLLKSRVSTYLEFKALGTFHTFENDCFEKVPGTKEDIFTDQSLSLLTKRALMKFMKFVIDWEPQYNIWGPYRKRPIREFLCEAFKLPEAQMIEIGHTIGLCSTLQVPTMVGLARIKRYLASLEVYGNFPCLYSMYGSAGEISQGFCRSAAVAGATYKLQCGLSKVDPPLNPTPGESESGLIHATLTDGTKVQITERIVCSPTNLASTVGQLDSNVTPTHPISRLVAIVGKSCEEWFAPQETAAIVVFPVDSLATHNTHVVQCLVMGSGSGTCPEGQAIWYLASSCPDVNLARADLDEALKKLELSILRESMDNIEINVGEGDIKFRDDGMPLLSSVRLGASLHEFVPKEKLKYILKLRYTQFTTAGSEEDLSAPVTPVVVNNNYKKDNVLSSVLLSNASTAEISYDGTVAEARRLYTAIVGADDDFFQVDFEDDDEDDEDINDVGMRVDNELTPTSSATTTTTTTTTTSPHATVSINVVNMDESPRISSANSPDMSAAAPDTTTTTVLPGQKVPNSSTSTSSSSSLGQQIADHAREHSNIDHKNNNGDGSSNSNGSSNGPFDPNDPLHPGIHRGYNSNNTSNSGNNKTTTTTKTFIREYEGVRTHGDMTNLSRHHPHDDESSSHDEHDHDEDEEELDTHVPDFGDDMEL